MNSFSEVFKSGLLECEWEWGESNSSYGEGVKSLLKFEWEGLEINVKEENMI